MLTINNIPSNQTLELANARAASNLNIVVTVVRNFRNLEKNTQEVPEIIAEITFCKDCPNKHQCGRYGCQYPGEK